LGYAGLHGVDLPALGIPTADEFVNRYAEQMNIQADIANKWSFYLVFNFFRGAAILQGVYKRFTLGMPFMYFVL